MEERQADRAPPYTQTERPIPHLYKISEPQA